MKNRYLIQTQTKRGIWVTRSRHPNTEQGRQDASTEYAWHEVNGRKVRSVTE